jgi:hypothetical protein
MPAINLTAAAIASVQNAWAIHLNVNKLLRTQLGLFLQDLIVAVPDVTNQGKRTVTNWIAIAAPIHDALPTDKGSEIFTNANDAGVLMHRICLAAGFAAAATPARITAGEAAAILASFNLRWV